jgi:hypothetical protein
MQQKLAQTLQMGMQQNAILEELTHKWKSGSERLSSLQRASKCSTASRRAGFPGDLSDQSSDAERRRKREVISSLSRQTDNAAVYNLLHEYGSEAAKHEI